MEWIEWIVAAAGRCCLLALARQDKAVKEK